MLNGIYQQLTATAALTLLTTTATTDPALAQRSFQVRNLTGQDVVQLYLSASDSQVWGLNSLERDRVLPHGESFQVELKPNCLYDIKAELENGQAVENRQIDTCSKDFFALSLTNVSTSTPNNSNAFASERGFSCDLSNEVPQTLYQGSSEDPEVWIRWGSNFFSSSGYDPLSRCQIVSDRLENYRRKSQLNYIGVGRMNNQNIICTALVPGECIGLIYTLKPQQDPVETLQQFMQHRSGVVGVSPLYESEDAATAFPFVDVRPFLDEESQADTSSQEDQLQLQKPSEEELRNL